MTTEKLSNIEVAELIGLSHVQVSRIRSGQRQAGYETMVMICKVFGWSMDGQATAREQGLYPTEFEKVLVGYALNQNTTVGPEERSPTPQ